MPLISNVNIKELPVIEEILPGNLLIVETEKGTHTIDFANFVVGPDNISFYQEIVSLSAQAISLSAALVNSTNSLSASVDNLIFSRINSLSSTVNQTYSRIFYNAGTLPFNVGETISSSAPIIVPPGVTLNIEDITLTFGDNLVPSISGIPSNPLWASLYGSPPNYTLQANIACPSLIGTVANYTVIKPY